MLATKKKAAEPTAAELIDGLRAAHLTPAELRSLIELVFDELIPRDLERIVRQKKQSRDGASLPEQMIRFDLAKYGNGCRCVSALRWLATET